MKLIVRIFLFLALALTIAYAGLFVFINTHGRVFAIESFKNNVGVTPAIGRLTMEFPFDLYVSDFKLDNVSFSEMHVIPNIFKTIKTRRIALEVVDISDMNIKLTVDDKGIDVGVLGKKLAYAAPEMPQLSLIPGAFAATNNCRPFSIDNFHLARVDIEVTNKAKGADEIYYLRDISLDLKDFVYPELTKFYIKLSASFESGKTFIRDIGDFDGWVDYAAKDMDLGVKFKNIDYCFFGKYMPPNWQPSKLGLKEAFLDIDINAKAKADDAVIYCTITAQRYAFVGEDNAQDLSRMKTIKTILAVLTGPKGKPVYTFNFYTKMDSPQFDLKILRQGLNGTVNMPWMLVDGLISGAVNALSKSAGGATTITGDTVNAAADFLTDIYKQVKGSHKKKHKSGQPKDEPVSANSAPAPVAVTAPNNSNVVAGISITIPDINVANSNNAAR